MGHYKIPSLDLRDRGFFSFLADKLNLSPTSEGNSQRGAGGNNPQFQGKINADTGANINFGNQVYYGGLNDQEALRTFKSRRINVLVKEISERIRRWNDSLLEKINAGFLRLQLYKKGLDTFKDDPSASVSYLFGNTLLHTNHGLWAEVGSSYCQLGEHPKSSKSSDSDLQLKGPKVYRFYRHLYNRKTLGTIYCWLLSSDYTSIWPTLHPYKTRFQSLHLSMIGLCQGWLKGFESSQISSYLVSNASGHGISDISSLGSQDLLHEHLLATTATSILDTLLLHLVVGNKLKNLAVEVSQTVEPTSLTSADRVSLAKSLPGSLSAKAVEALEGKVFYDLQLYEEALDLLEEVLSTFDVFKKLENGISVEESQTVEPTSPTSADRVSLAKSLPGSLSAKAVAAVEALEGKCVDTFITALQAVAEESGLLLKKLDKKLERTLLHSYCKDLTSQVSSEVDPVPLLPKVVSLLFLKVYSKALQAPGRAISAAVSHLKNKLGDSALKVLVDYHAATVVHSDLQSAATEVEEDCTSERILSEREFLAGLMPELKALVLNNDQACMQNKEFDGDDYHSPSLYSSSLDGL